MHPCCGEVPLPRWIALEQPKTLGRGGGWGEWECLLAVVGQLVTPGKYLFGPSVPGSAQKGTS